MSAARGVKSIVVHGGAGRVATDSIDARLAGCREAALRGWETLEHGGSALDAVTAAVLELEDNPLFNAGTGAPLNSAGEIELDASIMDGARRKAGAVGAVQRIKNPIALARRVLEDGRHVLLVGLGAEVFARERGISECPAEDLVTADQARRWSEKYGTVGCVARDAHARLAAATSTGGLLGKRPGRVGDSAIIGAGTFADQHVAVSCTGIGEAIMVAMLAKVAADESRSGLTPTDATRRALSKFKTLTGSEAGVILIDKKGRVAWLHNAPHMPVCAITSASGTPQLSI
ncbi:MAG: isoaspartyl peptidase/L-asparaginase family protein [Gammaproteobacteria bacterium]|nr:isoaspartyl peptidase/L-asparaginase family protein [Gammaproteobacteria bacterium]